MKKFTQQTRRANARRCALDGECELSDWVETDGDMGRILTPLDDRFRWVAPPPCSRPSPHLCGWYGEGRERG